MEKKREEKWTRFWLAWYTLGKHNRWVQLANILCSLEGLAVPAPELHINTLMRSWPRSTITEANQLSIWGESIVVPEKTSFSNKEKFSIWGEYGKWVKSVPHQRWWLRSLCWTGWLMLRGAKKKLARAKRRRDYSQMDLLMKQRHWSVAEFESRRKRLPPHDVHNEMNATIADEWECSRAIGAVMMMMMMMHKSQIYRHWFFLDTLEGRQMQRASLGTELIWSQHGFQKTGKHLVFNSQGNDQIICALHFDSNSTYWFSRCRFRNCVRSDISPWTGGCVKA